MLASKINPQLIDEAERGPGGLRRCLFSYHASTSGRFKQCAPFDIRDWHVGDHLRVGNGSAAKNGVTDVTAVNTVPSSDLDDRDDPDWRTGSTHNL